MMKNSRLLIVLCCLFLFSCVERGKPIETTKAKEETTVKTDKKVVYHYTCSKGHKGSNNAGVCPECSTPLVHNQAYHGSQSFAIPPPVTLDPSKSGNAATTPTQAPAPAQNARGEYHYICSNSQHTEGAGTAGQCKVCSTNLIHNQAYHQ